MSATAIARSPGVLRTLSLVTIARLPQSCIGVLILLHTREIGLSYAVGGVATAGFTLGLGAGSPLLGRLVDRRGQSGILYITGLIAGAAVIGIARVRADHPGVLIALAAVIGLAQPPIGACGRVILTRLVTGHNRDALFAFDVSLQQAVFVVGPLTLLWLASSAGPSVALEVTGLTMVLATSAFALGTKALTTRERHERSAHGPRLGAVAIPGVQTLVALTAALGISFGTVEVGVVVASERHHGGLSVSVLFCLWAFGALLGGLWSARRANRGNRIRETQMFLLALAAFTLLLAMPLPAWWLASCLVGSGVMTAPLLALLYTMMSDAAPSDVLTEAYAWEMTGTMAGVALGTAAAGVLATFAGVGAVFVVASVAVLASIVVWTRRATTVIPRGNRLASIPVGSTPMAGRADLQPVDAVCGRDRECMQCGC